MQGRIGHDYFAAVRQMRGLFAQKGNAGAETIYHGRTAFEYIQNHMGYRFVLKNSVFEYAKTCENLNINLMLENVAVAFKLFILNYLKTVIVPSRLAFKSA